MKQRIILFSFFLLFTVAGMGQLRTDSLNRLKMGNLVATTNSSYKWNINTYGGLNWVKCFPSGTTRCFKIDLESDTTCMSYSTGEIGFYQPDNSYNRVICYDVFIRFPFYSDVNTRSGLNVSSALGQMTEAIGRMQGQLVSGIHSPLSATRNATVPANTSSYLLVTTLDGQIVGKQPGGNLSAVDKTGLQAGTYCSTLFVDGQPAESANFIVTDF